MSFELRHLLLKSKKNLEVLKVEKVEKVIQLEIEMAQKKETFVPKVDKTRARKEEMEEYFKMKPTPMTEQVKRDLHIIKNRHVLDPKRHYKRSDAKRPLPKIFQVFV